MAGTVHALAASAQLPKKGKRVRRHGGGPPLRKICKPAFNRINKKYKKPYEYEPKPNMGSRTPDEHRRGPNGNGKNTALCCELF